MSGGATPGSECNVTTKPIELTYRRRRNEKGAVLAVMGPSGSGRMTLHHSVAQCIRGRPHLAGVEITWDFLGREVERRQRSYLSFCLLSTAT